MYLCYAPHVQHYQKRKRRNWKFVILPSHRKFSCSLEMPFKTKTSKKLSSFWFFISNDNVIFPKQHGWIFIKITGNSFLTSNFKILLFRFNCKSVKEGNTLDWTLLDWWRDVISTRRASYSSQWSQAKKKIPLISKWNQIKCLVLKWQVYQTVSMGDTF